MTPTETTALQIVSAVVISGVCVRLAVELVRAVRDRGQRNDDREIGISDLTDEPVAAYDTDGGVHLGPGRIGPTGQIDDRRPAGQPHLTQPEPDPDDPCGPEYWERFERATWKDKR